MGGVCGARARGAEASAPAHNGGTRVEGGPAPPAPTYMQCLTSSRLGLANLNRKLDLQLYSVSSVPWPTATTAVRGAVTTALVT